MSENGKSLASADSELVTCDSVVLVTGVRGNCFHVGNYIYLYLNCVVGRDMAKKGICKPLNR